MSESPLEPALTIQALNPIGLSLAATVGARFTPRPAEDGRIPAASPSTARAAGRCGTIAQTYWGSATVLIGKHGACLGSGTFWCSHFRGLIHVEIPQCRPTKVGTPTAADLGNSSLRADNLNAFSPKTSLRLESVSGRAVCNPRLGPGTWAKRSGASRRRSAGISSPVQDGCGAHC